MSAGAFSPRACWLCAGLPYNATANEIITAFAPDIPLSADDIVLCENDAQRPTGDGSCEALCCASALLAAGEAFISLKNPEQVQQAKGRSGLTMGNRYVEVRDRDVQ